LDINFNVGGAAGQGIDTIGDLLTWIFVKSGYWTFTVKHFESRIRGGYNFNDIRVSDSPIHAPIDDIDLIIAMTEDAITQPRNRLADGGVILFDKRFEFSELEECHYPAPLQEIAKEVGGHTRMTNAAALGAVLSILHFPFDLAKNALTSAFERKGDSVVDANVNVAKAMYDLTNEEFRGTCRQNLSGIKNGPCQDSLLINGNKALALGAMAANIKWISAYPMSPSTGAFEAIIAESRKLNIGTLQAEDELSAILMAIGASYGGTRSLVTTSGGGFSLMVEALGLAGITETPVVIYNAERPGPATGLPTRTEQGDLLFMAHASQGEFPRVLLAPKDPVEGFEVAWRAFNLADQFQIPVMILGDQYYADSTMNIPQLNLSNVEINRGLLSSEGATDYKRYELTEDGISPRAFPGDKGKTVVQTGNVHREDGHITEDQDIRNAMVEKLMKKIPNIKRTLNDPKLYGDLDAKITLLTWGTTWGAANEAMEILSAGGISINQLHFCDVYPLRTEFLSKVWNQAEKVIAVEQNFTSQFAKLVRMESGLTVNAHVNKYDGRPMSARWIIKHLEEVGIK
jgi:2-oxoglutarate ferredoxin oxidoreductase subunit alpha